MTNLLTVHETCVRLRISRSSLYRLIKARQLETVRLGKRVFVREDEPENLIKRSTTPARRRFFGATQ